MNKGKLKKKIEFLLLNDSYSISVFNFLVI